MTLVCSQGCDIPDIESVDQLGAPKSVAIWIQRAGRAGRNGVIWAVATLYFEKSAFEFMKPRAPSKKTQRKTEAAAAKRAEAGYPEEATDDVDEDSDNDSESNWGSDSSSDSDVEANSQGQARSKRKRTGISYNATRSKPPDGKVWRLKIDPDLRALRNWRKCRRVWVRKHFQNPKNDLVVSIVLISSSYMHLLTHSSSP